MKTLPLILTRISHAWPTWTATISEHDLYDIAQKIQIAEGQLLTLWGSDERFLQAGFKLHLIFIYWNQGILYLQCDLAAENPIYTDLSNFFPVANRLQRALFDLMGIKTNSNDQRSWLQHGAWPINIFPLRDEIKLRDDFASHDHHYTFIRVHGDGVHEIPVGPVHAGVIEPGHFRFQVVGERILRLEERLGYTHKGIAKHFQHCTFQKANKLAGRICGDSTVAYAWAYSMAIEHLHRINIPTRAEWLRALFLERERMMNHLGDLGALGNDAGLSFGLTQFSIIKENMLRLNAELFAHRYLMDVIVPGGVSVDLSSTAIPAISDEIVKIQEKVYRLKQTYADHEGLQDRFMTTGIVSLQLAKQLGMLGLLARASGLEIDGRTQFSCAPYAEIGMGICTDNKGDVAARVAVRFHEIDESLRIMHAIIHKLPEGNICDDLPELTGSHIGLGCIEGWRGPIFFAICNEDAKYLRWAHIHDASWQNWPALEHAVLGNIVADFPLINKSFNLGYSGHDS